MHQILEPAIHFVQHARAPQVRSIRQFAEEELTIPDGPYKDLAWRPEFQPAAGLWFDAVSDGMESGRFNRFAFLAGTQFGKTYAGVVVPTIYGLFELEENVVFGVSDGAMAWDKWQEDLLPAIERSRYRDLIPASGPGSRGGRASSIKFRNGATLRFMTGGARNRKAFTARIVVVTEVDELDDPDGVEADKVTQLEGRAQAYDSRKLIFLESTVTEKRGRIWQEWTGGTESRIALPCPYCLRYVVLTRADFVGWEDAEDEDAAAEGAAFHCTACGEAWEEEDRRTANVEAVLVHKGQSIDKLGRIRGEAPRTSTLSFRATAANNLFLSARELAIKEWRGSRAMDEDNAERELRQQYWALPYDPPKVSLATLDAHEITRRLASTPRGQVPDQAETITAGIDLGKWVAHWVAIAWDSQATGVAIDYGVIEIPTRDLGVEQATLTALRSFRDDVLLPGWPCGSDPKAERLGPMEVWIDAGWPETADVVYAFCDESGAPFRACKGFGTGQQRAASYRRPKTTGSVIREIGEAWHISRLKGGTRLVEVDADRWKSWIAERLLTPADKPGALKLYKTARPQEHLSIAKHFSAERQTQEFIAGRGTVTKWEQVSRNNHWFDAGYLAAAAANKAGVSLIDAETKRTTRQKGTWFKKHKRGA